MPIVYGGNITKKQDQQMAEDALRIKREPLTAPCESIVVAPPPLAHPTAISSAGAATRDHLRALLDRARANKSQHARSSSSSGSAGASQSQMPHAEIKRETTSDHAARGTNTPTAAPLPLMPRSSQASQGGLLPTPGSTATRSTDAAATVSQGTFDAYTLGTTTSQSTYAGMPAVFDHDHQYGHHHGLLHNYPAMTSEAPSSSSFFLAVPVPAHAPACSSCSHSGMPVVKQTAHSHAYYPESTPHWHYQAHPPPSLSIPTHPAYDSVGHTAIDTALTAHAATISPSISATTSTSSSSNKTTRRSRAVSPSSTSKAAASKRLQNQPMKKPDLAAADRMTVVAPLRPSSAMVSLLDEYEGHELHSDFVHTVHILIPTGSFGCLVGHKGECMKEINATSECTLSVRDESSFPAFEADRVLRIYGKPKGICFAQQMVIARIRKFRAEKGDSSYIDLGEDLLAPMTESSVTHTMSQAIEAVSDEDGPDAAAERGELRWLIHKSAVGKIMGQHGSIQKAIARDTNTTVHIVPLQKMARGSAERAVIITGEPADIKRARDIIEAKAGGRLDTHDANPGKSGQYYVIPQHVSGFLIGPKGTRIRKLRDETGASIQIADQQDLPLGYVNRMLHVQGTKEQMDKARDAIVRRLQSYMHLPEATSAAQEDEIALQLVLPVRISSFLLDQRGRLIREISEKAGAHARFLPPFDNDNRICVLYGDMSKVFRAERLVLQFIAGDAIANKWATAGGAPPRKRKRARERDDEDDDSDAQENGDELASDDDAISPAARGRARKRQQPENSGRIVVHYTAPMKHPSPRGSRRHSSSSRGNTHVKPNGRSRRRR